LAKEFFLLGGVEQQSSIGLIFNMCTVQSLVCYTCAVIGLPLSTRICSNTRSAARNDGRFLENALGAQFYNRSYANQAARTWQGSFRNLHA